jgi:hypothetical protein
MEFSYANFPADPDTAFPDRKALRRPVIGIMLKHGSKSIVTKAIIDSGADFCIFPSSIAAALGISIPTPQASSFSGTANEPQTAYFAVVQATIWNANSEEVPITFDLYAGFCETLEHVGLGLLGQEGFFSRFPITFDFASSRLSIG